MKLLLVSKLLPILLLLIHSLGAYAYPSEAIQINPNEFNRYVPSQFKSIQLDFFNMMEMLSLQKLPNGLTSEVIKLTKVLATFKSQCYQENKTCADVATQAKKHLTNLLKLEVPKFQTYAMHELNFYQNFEQFNSLNLNLYFHFVQYHDQYLARNSQNITKEAIQLNKQIQAWQHQIKLFLTNNILKPYDKFVRDFWIHFIDPIDFYFFTSDDQIDFLTKRVTDLNFAINEFSFLVTKKNKIAETSILNLATTLHRRWNSILKIILKP